MRRTAVVVLLAAVLISAIAPTIAVAAGDGGGGSGAAARNLTIDELAPGGTHPANAPPSVRANGAYGEFAVKYLPTGLLVQEGEDSRAWDYLEPGQTVRRNEIQLWSKRAYNADEEEYVVWIAHWEKGERTISSGEGETRTETVAQNVTVYKETVTFGPGYDYATIDLRAHYDGQVRTTMAIAKPGENPLAEPGDQRWTFYHESSRATIGVETLSAGGRLAWGLGMLVLPFFGTTVVVLYLGRQFIRKAKAGPHISAIWWVIAAVLFGIFILASWTWLSDTIIRAPYLIPSAFGVFLGLIAVEWFGRQTYGVGFLQFRLTEGYDPTEPEDVEAALKADGDGGDPTEAPGILKARFMVQRFADGETGGEPSAIRKGLRKFWARARGATADLEVDGNMQTKIETEGPIDELYLLDPSEEEPVDYQPERHEWRLPDLLEYDDEGNVKIHPIPYLLGIGFLGLSWLTGKTLTGSGLLGLTIGGFLLAITKVARPVDGKMVANLAPVHYNHAVASMLTHAKGLGEAQAWDDWFRRFQESEAEKDAQAAELEDSRQMTQMEKIYDRYMGKSDDAPTRSAEGSADD